MHCFLAAELLVESTPSVASATLNLSIPELVGGVIFPLWSLSVCKATEACGLDRSPPSVKALLHSVHPNHRRTHHVRSQAEELTD